MSSQQPKTFILIILYIIGNFMVSSAFFPGDIIVPPKLRNKTTPEMVAPTMLPQDTRQTTDVLDSIVKRSTVYQLPVPPTIHPKDGSSQVKPENVHLNLMVPPTISSAEKATNHNGGSLSPQVTGVLNSKPRVVCYADKPIERDVPCPTNHSTGLSVQHMQGLLKMMGGSNTVQLDTPTPTSFINANNDTSNKLFKPEEREKLNKILLEISLKLNQRMFSSRRRYLHYDLQAPSNEIIALTDALFKCLFSAYKEKYVALSLTSINPHNYNAQDIKSNGWQSSFVSKNASANFTTNIDKYNKTTEKMSQFYQEVLDTSINPADYKGLIDTIEREIDVDAVQIVYNSLKRAISNLKTMYSLVEHAVSNVTNSQRLSTPGDLQKDGAKQLLVALSNYVKSFTLFEDMRSDANQNFSSLGTIKMAANDTEAILVRVTQLLQSRVAVLEQLLDECNVEILDHKKNIDLFKNINWANGRKRRDIIGTSDMTCQSQGERIGGGNLLNLCSTCVQTSVLSEEFFPRYLTEKICQPDNLSAPLGPRSSQQGCLYQPGLGGAKVASGRCREQHFHINILKRVPGKCMKVQLDGQEVITDLWELTMHPLRVGCECAVDENSRFAQYVIKN